MQPLLFCTSTIITITCLSCNELKGRQKGTLTASGRPVVILLPASKFEIWCAAQDVDEWAGAAATDYFQKADFKYAYLTCKKMR